MITEKKRYTAAGTVFGNQFLRLVQLGPYHLDTYMDGVMLIFTHRDVPGLIGYIGTIFGKHQVNIAQMTVGRQVPGGEAIAVLNLDNLPPEEAIEKCAAIHKSAALVSSSSRPPAKCRPGLDDVNKAAGEQRPIWYPLWMRFFVLFVGFVVDSLFFVP